MKIKNIPLLDNSISNNVNTSDTNDIDDTNNFDFVLDTTYLSFEEVFEKVIEDHENAQREALKLVYEQLEEAQNDLKYLDEVNE